MIHSENLREKNQPLNSSAEMHVAAEPIAMQHSKKNKNEDDITKTDKKPVRKEYKMDKTKKTDVKEKNKTIKKNLMSKIKENKTKKAAQEVEKNVRKITEFTKPKPEQPRNPASTVENLVPGAAIAGSLVDKLGPENVFSGASRKPDKNGKVLQPTNGGLADADFDWPDGTRGPG